MHVDVSPRGSTTELSGSAGLSAVAQDVAVQKKVGARRSAFRAFRGHRALVSCLITIDAVAFLVSARLLGMGWLPTLVLLALVTALFAAGGLYRARLGLSVLDDAPALLGRALVAGAVGALLLLLAGRSWDGRAVLVAMLFGVGALVLRGCFYGFARFLRNRRLVSHSALIVGAGSLGCQLAQTLEEHPEYGLEPIGFVDNDPDLLAGERAVPHLGECRDLARVIAENDIGNVVVAFAAVDEAVLVDVLRTCDRMDCEIFAVPRLYEMAALGPHMEFAWGVPLVRLRRPTFRSPTWRIKRVADFLIASFGLLALSPVMLVCGVAARYETGSAFFGQERVGLDGAPFTLYKFCSVRPREGAEAEWSVAEDARLGRVGRLLRRTSLDELPQLWNIVRGDMSLVGPRPERAFFVEKFSELLPRYMARHRVPSGLTGWAQVHGLRGDTSIAERARFDNHYIENWSLWTDMKIILRTVGVVLRGSGR